MNLRSFLSILINDFVKHYLILLIASLTFKEKVEYFLEAKHLISDVHKLRSNDIKRLQKIKSIRYMNRKHEHTILKKLM